MNRRVSGAGGEQRGGRGEAKEGRKEGRQGALRRV